MSSRQWLRGQRPAARDGVRKRGKPSEGAPVRLVMAMVALGMLVGALAAPFEPSEMSSVGGMNEAVRPSAEVEPRGASMPADRD
jgi:hypothetical protein